jgi:hypothetical protein
MQVRYSPTKKRIALNIRALGIGVFVATALVTGYTLLDAAGAQRVAGGSMLMPPQAQAEFALFYSAFVAVLLAALCVPVWLLLAKVRLDRWYAAAALGFVAVMAFWIFDNVASPTPITEIIRSGLVYALCGAAAGLATWWASPRS